MTNNRFISLLRDYAALARARRISYATPVQTLVALRQAEVERSTPAGTDADTAKADVAAIAVREYGKFDPEFSVTGGG